MAYRPPRIKRFGHVAQPAKAWCDWCGDDVPIPAAADVRRGRLRVKPPGECLCETCKADPAAKAGAAGLQMCEAVA